MVRAGHNRLAARRQHGGVDLGRIGCNNHPTDPRLLRPSQNEESLIQHKELCNRVLEEADRVAGQVGMRLSRPPLYALEPEAAAPVQAASAASAASTAAGAGSAKPAASSSSGRRRRVRW